MGDRLRQALGTAGISAFVWFMIFLTLTGRADDGPALLNDLWSANIATAAAVLLAPAMWRLFSPPGRQRDRL